jgi:drug/metabolite transporter (DMT)-like permease
MERRLLFVSTLLTATFLMGSSFIAGKILLQAGYPPILLAAARFSAAALLTLPVLFALGRAPEAVFPAAAGIKDIIVVMTLGLLQTAGVMGLLFLAMRSISVPAAAILLFTNPLWVAFLATLVLKEPITAARTVALALGILGAGLALGVSRDMFSGAGAVRGEIIGLGSSFCWALATIVNKRVRTSFNSWALSFWQMLAGSIFLLAWSLAIAERWPHPFSPREWLWFLWLAGPGSAGSFGLWFVALKTGGASKASSYLFLAPLFAVLMSFLVLDTALSWRQALGGSLVALALWLVNRDQPGTKDQERQALAEGNP